METILLVEDNPGVLALGREILATAGYTVLEAGTADEALVLSRSGQTIDLVITDIVLPGVRGTTLAKKLILQHPRMKILLTSGYLDSSESGETTAFEDLPFLQKPFTSTTLKEKVRAVLDADRPV